MSIDEMLEDLIEKEGGYINHPADRGGPTKYGITQTTLDEFSLEHSEVFFNCVKDITRGYAKRIYRSNYYKKPNLDDLGEERLQTLMFDCCVLHGRGTAVRWLQRACGAKVDGHLGPQTLQKVKDSGETVYTKVLSRRINFIANIVARDHSQVVFLRGWISRATEFL